VGAHGAYDPRRVDADGVQQPRGLPGPWHVGYVASAESQDRRAMRLIGQGAQHGLSEAALGPGLRLPT